MTCLSSLVHCGCVFEALSNSDCAVSFEVILLSKKCCHCIKIVVISVVYKKNIYFWCFFFWGGGGAGGGAFLRQKYTENNFQV